MSDGKLTESGGTVKLPIPGVQYGMVEAPLDADEKRVMDRLQAFREAYLAYLVRYGGVRSDVPVVPLGPAIAIADAPQPAPVTPAVPAPTREGTGFYCPDHKVEVRKTAPQYDKDGDRYYHPLERSDWYKMEDGRTVKNHNLYRRQLVGPDGFPVEDSDDHHH